MSCYRPMVASPTGEKTAKGKPVYRFHGLTKDGKLNPGEIVIPCGRCLGCRLDYSRKWADRMMLELETVKKAVFVTLTYSEDVVPLAFDPDTGEAFGRTLRKKDCQDFIKRLRQHLPDVHVSYFLAGEYGPSTLRPHYHAIIYGISLEDLSDRKQTGKNDLGQPYFESKWFSDIWSFGRVVLSDVSYETCAYVARYVIKKAQSSAEYTPEDIGLDPEFVLMSKNPAIGKRYLEEHPNALDFDNITVPTLDGAKKIQVPAYYLRLLGKEPTENSPNPLYNKELYDILRSNRRISADDFRHDWIREQDQFYLDHLQSEESQKSDAIKALKNRL